LNVYLIVLLITIFYVFLGVFVFFFLHPYHAHKLDFRSSPCMLLRYSSSHLDYYCLDLASQRIYVSRHVCFHEDVFPFAISEQIAQQAATPSQPTHLLTLTTSLNFLPVDPLYITPSRYAAPLAPPKQPHRPPSLSAIIPTPPILASMPSSTCFSNDHFQVCHCNQLWFYDRFSYIFCCELRSFNIFSCKSITLCWSLILSSSAAFQFRFFCPSVCCSSASDSSSPSAAKD